MNTKSIYTNKDLIETLQTEFLDELNANEEFADKNFNEKALIKNKMTNKILSWILSKIVGKIKLEVILWIDDKKAFDFTIPQN